MPQKEKVWMRQKMSVKQAFKWYAFECYTKPYLGHRTEINTPKKSLR